MLKGSIKRPIGRSILIRPKIKTLVTSPPDEYIDCFPKKTNAIGTPIQFII